MHRDATKGCPLPEKNELVCEIFSLLLKVKLRGYSVCLQTSANNRSQAIRRVSGRVVKTNRNNWIWYVKEMEEQLSPLVR
jgi:hypothetical protein